MAIITPAILTDNPDLYKERIEKFQAFANTVHIDYADGEFAPSFTLNPQDIWWPPEWKATIHAMVIRPSEHVDELIAKKPDMVIFHTETDEDIRPVMDKLKSVGIRAGVALLKTTVPSQVAPLIQAADHVMIFSGELGKHGGKASLMQLEKVRLVKAIRPTVEIGWDGGVTIENAFSMSQGGVDVLNVGGLLANSKDPQETYDALVKEINRRSVI